MTPRTKKQFEEIREEKKELIANTALQLFSEKGYHAATISEIARQAKISKGLIYNYFESKEQILVYILDDFVKLVSNLMNPNNDDEITNEEMENFFDLLIETMKTNSEHWKVVFQLAMQKDVASMMLTKEGTSDGAVKLLKLGYQYFADRFENPAEELLLFRSVVKGLALIIVYTPEMCPDELINSIKRRLKGMFIKPKNDAVK